jgi:competence protein ComEC
MAWATGIVTTHHSWLAPAWAITLWTIALSGLTWASAIHRPTRRPSVALAIVILTSAAGAMTATHVSFAEQSRDALRGLEITGGRAIAVEAVVVGKVEHRSDGSLTFDASASQVRTGPTVHVVSGEVSVRVAPADVSGLPSLDVGAHIVAAGTARHTEAADRAVLEITASRGVEIRQAPEGLLRVASDLRQQLVEAARALPEPGAQLVPGLAVGDTALVDNQLDSEMKASSLSHLTAVSGANCALVVGLAFACAALCGASRALRVTVGMVALAGFVVLVTPEPSVVRAGAMATIAMLAVLWGRPGAGLAVLSFAVTVLLVIDPWLSMSLGFALSAAATCSLLLLSRPLADGLARHLPRPLALAISIPLAAQLACGPLLTLIAPTVPLYGVMANMLAAPAAPVATIVGLAACLTSWAPPLRDGLIAIAWLPAAWVAGTARTFASLPGGSLPWLEGWPGAASLAAVGVCIALVVGHFRTHHAATRVHRTARTLASASLAITVGALAGTMALGSFAGRLTLPADWSVLMCDVGQGDAILIRSEDQVALVDLGPDAAALGSCLARAGVDRIDLLVLSHFDEDHVGGADAVAGRVDTVIHGPVTPEGQLLLTQLKAEGTATHLVSAGRSGSLGAANWRVLWPATATETPGNDASVVLEVAGGGVPSLLLLGDLSESPQRSLQASGALAAHYDVVKVAHHGSADQSAELYHEVSASIGLIPVGQDNRYEHPRAEILDVLEDAGTRIARTDEEGMVVLSPSTEGISVWRERDVDVGAAE